MGFLDGLLGGDDGASQYRGQQQQYLSGLGTLGGQYGNLASQAQGQYDQYQPEQQQALGNYANYLQTDPYTSQYGAAAEGQAMGDTTRAFLQARAHLASDSLVQGFSGGASSNLTGGLTSLYNGQASAQAGAADQVATQRIADQGQRLGQLTDLYGGAANEAYGHYTGALGDETSVYGSLAGQYGGLAQDAQARADARDNALYGGLGSLATLGAEGAFGGMLGGGEYDPFAGEQNATLTNSGGQ